LRVADTAIERIPDDAQLYIWRSILLCNLNSLSDADFERMKHVVVSRNYDLRALGLYTALVKTVTEQSCPSISSDELRTLFTEMLEVPLNANPNYPMFSQIKFFIGVVDIHLDHPQRALSSFKESLQARPGAGHAMQMAAHMASGEFYDEAMLLSGIALANLSSKDGGLIRRDQINASDVHDFRQKVQIEIENMSRSAAEEETSINDHENR